jgi:hypothetical protein
MSYEFEYGSSLRLLAMTSRRVAHRQEIRGRSPVGCGGRRHFLRTLGIEITFSREGRTGTRMIKLSTSAENNVSTVSTVSAARSNGSRGDQAILAEIRE